MELSTELNDSTDGPAPRKLSKRVMVAFAAGQFAEGVKNQAFNVFVIFYYQQVLGVPGTLTGIALGIALLFDAFSDPIAGVASDRLRSRWGRRHPFMAAAAIPLGIALYLIFNPPAGLSEFSLFLWLTGFAVLVRGALTCYHVPHLALGAEMCQDYNQRSVMFGLSSYASIGAMALTSFLGFRYFFPTTEQYTPGHLNPDAYVAFAAFFAILSAGSILLCVWGTASEIKHLKVLPNPAALNLRTFGRQFADVFANRNFRALFFGLVLASMSLTLEAAMGSYSGPHFWGLTTEQMSVLPIATLAGMTAGLFFIAPITRVLDKKLALILPAVTSLVIANFVIISRLLELSWLPPLGSDALVTVLLVRGFLAALCYPVVFASLNSMFADVADELELSSGERREGVLFSTRSFSTKATASLGALMAGISLDVINFPQNASVGEVPETVIWNLGLVEGPIAGGITLLGVLLYMTYGLNRDRHREIVTAIEARRSAQPAEPAA